MSGDSNPFFIKIILMEILIFFIKKNWTTNQLSFVSKISAFIKYVVNLIFHDK